MDNPQAFPLVDEIGTVINHGMTLRDYYSIHASDEDVKWAMGEIQKEVSDFNAPCPTPQQARFYFADAMLKERSKHV